MAENQPISKTDIAEILEELDRRIVALARKRVPRYAVRPGEQDLEIDELAQQTRIKLWLALEKGGIANPTGYAGSIAYTEAIDMLRRFRSVCVAAQKIGEQLYNESMRDPSLDIEQEEALKICVTRVAQAIRALPPCQKRAMICALKDAPDDTLPLLMALQASGVDVESMQWPDDKVAAQRLRASLWVSREKLRCTCAAR